YANDVGPALACVRGSGERFEIQNLGPKDRVQVNGEGVQKAWLHHGDLIAMGSSLMIFDSDESDISDSSGRGAVPAVAPAPPQWTAAKPTDQMRVAAFSGSEIGEADPLLGSVNLRSGEQERAEKINYRQKHYQDHDAVLKGIGDARRIKTLLKVSS